MKRTNESRVMLPIVFALGMLGILAGEARSQAGTGSGSAAGQTSTATGRVMGQVLSAETGGALPGAQLQVEGASRGTVAGIEGRYQMDGVPVGELSLRITT